MLIICYYGPFFPLQLGNDMMSRLKNRLNNNVKRQEILTMIGFLLPGSVFLYNGDEIYMVDVSLTNWSIVTKSKPWRNPMLWDNTSYVGFSNSSCSSLPLKQNKTINVKVNIHFFFKCVCECVCANVCVCKYFFYLRIIVRDCFS